MVPVSHKKGGNYAESVDSFIGGGTHLAVQMESVRQHRPRLERLPRVNRRNRSLARDRLQRTTGFLSTFPLYVPSLSW
jgi:hypothetical protein